MINDKVRHYGLTKNLSFAQLRDCFRDEAFDFLEYAALFGSRAQSAANIQSDYDIAVYSAADQKPTWGLAAVVWATLGRRCDLDDCDMDIIDLSTATEAMLDSISKSYIVLKGDEDGFSELLAKLRRSR